MKSLPLQRFDLVTFDLDGVLTDSNPAHSRAFDDLWYSIGLNGPPYELIAGRRTREVVKEVTQSLQPGAEQLDRWIQFKQDRARSYLATADLGYTDTVPTLRALTSAGVRLAVGTGASRDTAEFALGRLGIEGLFEVVVCAEDVRRGKPAPEVYQRVFELARVSPERALVVEDSVPGLRAALDAQAFALSVRTGHAITHPRFLGRFPDLRAVLVAFGLDTAPCKG